MNMVLKRQDNSHQVIQEQPDRQEFKDQFVELRAN